MNLVAKITSNILVVVCFLIPNYDWSCTSILLKLTSDTDALLIELKWNIVKLC